MMVWDCIEVGRNDAANLVNAVFGARVLKRKKAIIVAGIFVILTNAILVAVAGGEKDSSSIKDRRDSIDNILDQ